MGDSKDNDIMSSELESRLDDLFNENQAKLLDSQDGKLKEDYPLAELRNLILSIDWEITDEVLESLLVQLEDLRSTYKHDKIVMTFLQILNSLVNYIKTYQASANPRTFKILNSVFSSLEQVVLSKNMAEAAKKELLRAEMKRYKELRAQIAKRKTAAAKNQAGTKPGIAETPIIVLDEVANPPAETATKVPPLTPEEPQTDAAVATLAAAVEEIKRYIHTEISALKDEIKSLREHK